jgi:hypothetical protein
MTDGGEVQERRQTGGRLVLGLFLLAIGALLLADNLGFEVPSRVWSYWPFLLLGLGTVKLLWPGTPDERRGGYWLLVVGLWGAVNVFGLFGLDWSNSWPLFLVAVGVLMVFEGALGRRLGAGSRRAT